MQGNKLKYKGYWIKNLKAIVDLADISDDENTDIVKPVVPRVTITGKTLDQNKMLKRKMKNCDNGGWITLESGGQYPKQALVTLKTGLFEVFKNDFLNLMKSFSIQLTNQDSIKVTKNENGIERER